MRRLRLAKTPLKTVTFGFAGLVGLSCVREAEDGPTIIQGEFGEDVVLHGGLGNHAPVFHTRVILAIGEGSGSIEAQFGEVVGADILGAGMVGVLDGQFGEVRMFGPDGVFRTSISRFGSGPGEISGEGTMGIVAIGSSRFLLPDIVNLNVQAFDLEGELVSTERLGMSASELPIEWRDGRDSLVSVRIASRDKSVVVRRSVEGTRRDTLAVVERSDAPTASDGLQPIWVDHVVWATGEPDIAVVGQTFRPQFTVYKSGKRLRTVVWEVEDRELTEAQQDSLLWIVAGRLGWDEGELPAGFRDRFRLPRRIPAIADIEFTDGIVLVQRVRAVGSMNREVTHTLTAVGLGDRRWDAFSIAGDYLGVIDMGARADVFGVRGDTIVGVRRDGLGRQEVFLARVPIELKERH